VYFNAIRSSLSGKIPPYSGKLGAEDAAQGYRDTAYRVVADHLRTLVFAISDGALPGNEGRGYVIRRICRRALRYARENLGAEDIHFLSKLVRVVTDDIAGGKDSYQFYKDVKQKRELIESIIREEELAFSALLARGIKYFKTVLTEMQADPCQKFDAQVSIADNIIRMEK
jgi:alanyl-tRNA synthetase